MVPLQQALLRHRAQEAERELIRQIRREATRTVLDARDFHKMRAVIPQWWEWVCTGLVSRDDHVADLIDRRLSDTAGLQDAIIDDWA